MKEKCPAPFGTEMMEEPEFYAHGWQHPIGEGHEALAVPLLSHVHIANVTKRWRLFPADPRSKAFHIASSSSLEEWGRGGVGVGSWFAMNDVRSLRRGDSSPPAFFFLRFPSSTVMEGYGTTPVEGPSSGETG